MICCPDIHHLSADKVKLRNELQNIQVSVLLLLLLLLLLETLSQPESQGDLWPWVNVR